MKSEAEDCMQNARGVIKCQGKKGDEGELGSESSKGAWRRE